MRTLLKFEVDTEVGNRLIRSGEMEKSLQGVLEQLRPEAAYFLPQNGCRGGFLIFDLADASQIPAIVEPMFEAMHAHVELCPVMNADDLRTGLSNLRQGS